MRHDIIHSEVWSSSITDLVGVYINPEMYIYRDFGSEICKCHKKKRLKLSDSPLRSANCCTQLHYLRTTKMQWIIKFEDILASAVVLPVG